jgi:hypothetical protein
MKKIIFLAAATMLWGCGPQDEAQDIQEQEQLGQQESALDYSRDPIIGKWYWVGGPDYKADVRIDGTGYQISGDCFNGTPMWRYIAYSRELTGGVKVYTGQVGANPSVSAYCTWTTWRNVSFRANPDWQNMTIIYSSTYSEAYKKFY